MTKITDSPDGSPEHSESPSGALLREPCGARAMSTWGDVAEGYLEQALDEVRDGDDAIAAVSSALAALRIEAGELPADEMDVVEDADLECTCPPELLARGGYRSSCPLYGRSHAAAGRGGER